MPSPSDFFSLGVLVTPGWILFGSALGMHALWGDGMTRARKITLGVYAIVSIILIFGSWWNGAAQQAHNEAFEGSIQKIANALQLPPDISAQALADVITRKTNRARLQFTSVAPIQYPNAPGQQFNVNISNAGNLATLKTILQVSGLMSDTILSADEEQLQMDKLRARVKAVDISKVSVSQIQPGTSAIITLSDLYATADDIKNINDGKKVLYVFAVSNYEDDEIAGNGYWAMEYCGYFAVHWDYWHNCTAPSHIDFFKGPR
jgi:hypothetical protein